MISRVAPTAALVAVALAMAGPAQAQAPTTTRGAYSPYEQETITRTLGVIGGKIDPSPVGKIVEKVDVFPLEVFEDRDPPPSLLNILHVTTKPYVLDRESLLRPGQRFEQTFADESARNLAALFQLSLVLVLALEGSAPGRVRVLIITKDVWSLRLNWNASVTPGGLEDLYLQPSERNFLGTHQTLFAQYEYQPESQTFGVGYSVPRLDGRRLQLDSQVNVVVNNRSGIVEGSLGGLTIQRPLFSSVTDWVWSTGVVWDDEVFRNYINAHLATYDPCGAPSCDTHIPYEYRSQRIIENAQITRSFGWEQKNDFTLGAEVNRNVDRVDEDVSGFSPSAVAEFERTQVPVSDTRVGPYVQWRSYTTNFIRVLDYDTLALQEDFRQGQDIWVRLYPVTQALGSSRNFFGTYAAAQYTAKIGGGILRGAIESTTEAQVDRLTDASVAANVHLVTPRLGIGRLVFDGSVLNRYRNYLNVQTFLGGDTRLRGFPTSSIYGKDAAAANVEFRTLPVDVFTCEIGGVVFFDSADAADGFDHLVLQHSVGFGIRALFPWLDRTVFRADVGIPVGTIAPLPSGVPVSPWSFFITFQQAIPFWSVGGTAAATGGYAPSAASGGFAPTTVGGALGQ
jgi:hypothetical protein